MTFFVSPLMFRNINYRGFVNLFVCLWYELEIDLYHIYICFVFGGIDGDGCSSFCTGKAG